MVGIAYLTSMLLALHPFEIPYGYKAGDPKWDSEAEDAEDVEGGGYIDTSKVARDPKNRTRDE